MKIILRNKPSGKVSPNAPWNDGTHFLFSFRIAHHLSEWTSSHPYSYIVFNKSIWRATWL